MGINTLPRVYRDPKIALDSSAGLRTLKRTFGLDGIHTDTDFVVTLTADTANKDFDLGSVIPAGGKIESAYLINTEAASGGSLSGQIGTTSGGSEISTLGSVTALNDIHPDDATGSLPVNIAAAASNLHVRLSIVGVNWDTLTAGKWELRASYTQYQ